MTVKHRVGGAVLLTSEPCALMLGSIYNGAEPGRTYTLRFVVC